MDAGSVVIVHLGAPREQVFGVIVSIQPAGVVVRGVTMSSVEDWLRGLSHAEADAGTTFGLTTTFYPMHRVEKLVLDEASHGAPAIGDRFRQRLGMSLPEFLATERTT